MRVLILLLLLVMPVSAQTTNIVPQATVNSTMAMAASKASAWVGNFPGGSKIISHGPGDCCIVVQGSRIIIGWDNQKGSIFWNHKLPLVSTLTFRQATYISGVKP